MATVDMDIDDPLGVDDLRLLYGLQGCLWPHGHYLTIFGEDTTS